jgi:hypothetical protein
MMIFDEYSFPDDATIANADQYKVYYKPEDGVCGTNNYVKPGKFITDPIDGVATSKYQHHVFKVPDGGRVKVTLGGDIELKMSAWGQAKLTLLKTVNPDYSYKWLMLNQLDDSWKTLFDMALKIKP